MMFEFFEAENDAEKSCWSVGNRKDDFHQRLKKNQSIFELLEEKSKNFLLKFKRKRKQIDFSSWKEKKFRKHRKENLFFKENKRKELSVTPTKQLLKNIFDEKEKQNQNLQTINADLKFFPF
jgi:hypothetical protein